MPNTKINSIKFTDNPLFLSLTALSLLILAYIYHGFLIYNSDTIETVPYALWMADISLFPHDFHLSHIREAFPNERWLISWLLHWFPSSIVTASLIFHGIFAFSLFAGMIRLADLVLKNLEFAVLAVFVSIFTLYNINVGSNELYYNMFVSSLAAKGVSIWALVFMYQKQWIKTAIILALATFLHPLVGFQLFVLISGIMLLTDWKGKGRLSYFLIYLLSAGVWIILILGAQGSILETNVSFIDIVRFRIAHHFFPEYFPMGHLMIHGVLYSLGIVAFYKKFKPLFYFFILALFGILVYLIGIYLDIEVVLSSQWMKINIWLKFLSIIGILRLVQGLLEQKQHRIFVLIAFVISLVFASIRFNPHYDSEPETDLYSWIMINSDKDDLFLVPSTLVDFKARTLRSSYFDFKAMLHHKPAIYQWAIRMQMVYGLDISDRSPNDEIFSKVRNNYLKGRTWERQREIDYFIIPKNNTSETYQSWQKENRKPVFLGKQYNIYKNENKRD